MDLYNSLKHYNIYANALAVFNYMSHYKIRNKINKMDDAFNNNSYNLRNFDVHVDQWVI